MRLVSVCIPVYNPGPFLATAVASVLSQNHPNFELILVDDQSTQPILPILAQFDDLRLKFFQNTHNLGLVGNWNRCLQLANGDYITIFHQDDVMQPDNLTAKSTFLDNYPTAGCVYSGIRRINEAGEIVGGHWAQQPKRDCLMPGWALFRQVAALGNPVSCPSVLVRRDCYDQLGSFDSRLPFATDLEMWLRIAAVWDVGFLAAPFIHQRVHTHQETARFDGTGRDYQDVLHAYDLVYGAGLPDTHNRFASKTYKTLANQALRMSQWQLRQGKISSGWRYAAVAVKAMLRSNNLSMIAG